MIPSVVGLAAFPFTEGWRYCEYEEWILHTWANYLAWKKEGKRNWMDRADIPGGLVGMEWSLLRLSCYLCAYSPSIV
jgi:hypothetical protein